jgi:hypothetical protein
VFLALAALGLVFSALAGLQWAVATFAGKFKPA